MLTAVEAPVILSPSNNDMFDFGKPILIRWQYPSSLLVTNFHLCIGTKPGTWNMLSGDIGLTDQFSFTPFPLTENTTHIYIQLIYKTIVTEYDQEGEETKEEIAFRIGNVITLERAIALSSK